MASVGLDLIDCVIAHVQKWRRHVKEPKDSSLNANDIKCQCNAMETTREYPTFQDFLQSNLTATHERPHLNNSTHFMHHENHEKNATNPVRSHTDQHTNGGLIHRSSPSHTTTIDLPRSHTQHTSLPSHLMTSHKCSIPSSTTYP